MKESKNKGIKHHLRNNEYYDVQKRFDDLYDKSKNGYKFNRLLELITTEENILLAFRNIRHNDGSMTAGTDNKTILDFKNISNQEIIKMVRNSISNYKPGSVRRVDIPKPNGKTRPLGIPCIKDRLIQQCIKQILEPICEAKFYNHSYGFRANRSTNNAIARCMAIMNRTGLHYVVDVDIKGFFDNINHSKLKKQLWNLGIQDKNLMSIIGKILKSEIKGEGIPTKGTPQGGIISPLLANVVLNELDWWVSSQWETLKTRHNYDKAKGTSIDRTHKYEALKRTKARLKEVYIVRYADDFKIFCRDYKSAYKMFKAVKMWLKERLSLEVSNEKSKITNLRKNYTEFLGMKLMVKPKKGKLICQSYMANKAKKNAVEKLKQQIIRIKKTTNAEEVMKLNSKILGMHNYYKCATNANLDFQDIHYLVMRILDVKLRQVKSNSKILSKTYRELYGSYNYRTGTVAGVTIYPIAGCKHKPPMCFKQSINNYTEEGRNLIHKSIDMDLCKMMKYIARNSKYVSLEQLDNSISLLSKQKGRCTITKKKLDIHDMECHHKKPKQFGGTDEFKNLVWITKDSHKLVHATREETIIKYENILKLDTESKKSLNSLRKLVGNSII